MVLYTVTLSQHSVPRFPYHPHISPILEGTGIKNFSANASTLSPPKKTGTMSPPMRVQYFGYEYEMAEHIHFNNEVTTAKLLAEKIAIRQSNFFQYNSHKTQTTEMTTVT